MTNKYSLEIVENGKLKDNSSIYFNAKKELIEYCAAHYLENDQKWYVTCGYDSDTVFYDEELTKLINQ